MTGITPTPTSPSVPSQATPGIPLPGFAVQGAIAPVFGGLLGILLAQPQAQNVSPVLPEGETPPGAPTVQTNDSPIPTDETPAAPLLAMMAGALFPAQTAAPPPAVEKEVSEGQAATPASAHLLPDIAAPPPKPPPQALTAPAFSPDTAQTVDAESKTTGGPKAQNLSGLAPPIPLATVSASLPAAEIPPDSPAAPPEAARDASALTPTGETRPPMALRMNASEAEGAIRIEEPLLRASLLERAAPLPAKAAVPTGRTETEIPDPAHPQQITAPAVPPAAVPRIAATNSAFSAPLQAADAGNSPPAAQSPAAPTPAALPIGRVLAAAMNAGSSQTENLRPDTVITATMRTTMGSQAVLSAGSSVPNRSASSEKDAAHSEQETPPSHGADRTASPMGILPRHRDSFPEAHRAAMADSTGRVVESPAPQPQERARVAEQVLQKMETLRLTHGRQEITLRLQPEHLGHVQLTVTTEQNQVSARILAETPMVRQSLEDSREQLRAALEQKGFQLQQLDVSLNQGGGQERFTPFQAAYEPPAGRAFPMSAPQEPDGAEMAGTEIRSPVRWNGRVDYAA